jgi:hypothetical protein
MLVGPIRFGVEARTEGDRSLLDRYRRDCFRRSAAARVTVQRLPCVNARRNAVVTTAR